MKLIITIDTEEDNWLGYYRSDYTTENARRLGALQQLFDEFGIRPTYLVTYVMLQDPVVVSFLGEVHAAGRCELGTHCHPWNTPPVSEEPRVQNTMLCNLPPSLQAQKIRSLTEFMKERVGVKPVSFRAGRWGYSLEVGRSLARQGYRVDSSITPYYDWSADHGPDFSDVELLPYWNIEQPGNGGPAEPLVEIPTTIGYLQTNFRRAERLRQLTLKRPLRRLRLHGILYRLRLLNRIWLCPEHHGVKEMIGLTEVLRRKQFPIVNMMFHSPTLQAGLTPFVRSIADEHRFTTRIRGYLEYARGAGLASVTLAEAATMSTTQSASSAFGV